MLTIPLNDGTSAPWLAFGTGTALNGKDASALCSLALDRGFRHIDTAQLYRNEDSVGRSITASGLPRSSVYITTKLAKLPDEEGRTTVEETLRTSLRELQVDYVDLFLIHVPTYFDDRLEDIWAQMVDVKRKGLTKSIGVSNFNVKYLTRILATGMEAPAVNQIEYHPFVHGNLEPLLALQAKYRIVTASFGGLSPILPGRAGREAKLPARARLAEALDKLAAARSGEGVIATRNQVLLKWLQQQGVIVVTTSSKQDRIDEYLFTEALPNLTTEELKEIESTFRGVHQSSFLKLLFHMEDQMPMPNSPLTSGRSRL